MTAGSYDHLSGLLASPFFVENQGSIGPVVPKAMVRTSVPKHNPTVPRVVRKDRVLPPKNGYPKEVPVANEMIIPPIVQIPAQVPGQFASPSMQPIEVSDPRRVIFNPGPPPDSPDPLQALLGPGYRVYVLGQVIKDLSDLLVGRGPTVTEVIEKLRRIQ